jgi:hypothetical protein
MLPIATKALGAPRSLVIIALTLRRRTWKQSRSDGFATVLPPISLAEGFTITTAGTLRFLPFGMTAKDIRQWPVRNRSLQ